jgi:hypothetical protein
MPADPVGYRAGLLAVVALADAHPDAYHEEPVFHAAVETARRALDAGGRPRSYAYHRLPDQLGRYLLGLWAADVVHSDHCDCDLDGERLGVLCASRSGARPALLRDEGGFAPSLLMYLPPLGPPPDDPPDGPLWVATETAPAGPGPSSPLEARIGRSPMEARADRRIGEAHIEDWPPTPGEVQADQEGQL